MIKDFLERKTIRRLLKLVKLTFIIWLGWNLFYYFVFPFGCMFAGYDPRMISYRYSVEGTKYDGNFVGDFRRGLSLHPGYAIEIEFPMIYYYGEEGFVVLNEKSPVIKILKAENPNYSRYWWEDREHKYVDDVIICEKISDLTPKEREMYYKLKKSPMMRFPSFDSPNKYNLKEMYENMQLPRPYEEEYMKNKNKN